MSSLAYRIIWRIAIFFCLLFLPPIFGWWLFAPMAFIFALFAHKAYEPIVAGALLDGFYFFGNNFALDHLFLGVGLFCAIISVFSESRLEIRKIL